MEVVGRWGQGVKQGVKRLLVNESCRMENSRIGIAASVCGGLRRKEEKAWGFTEGVMEDTC